MDFLNLFTPKAVEANYTEAAKNKIPYFGASLFPAKKKAGLDLSWFQGAGGLPVSLAPTAFDAKATFRSIGNITKVETEMPFFREGFLISEKDRQELIRAYDVNDPYIQAVIDRIFDFTNNLVEGAEVVAERMRMSLLFPSGGDVKITFKANGVAYEYNYDSASAWKTSNYSALSSTALWSAASTADPIKDFMTMADKAASVSGSVVRYAVMSNDTFNKMIATDAVKNRWLSASGIKAGYLTPGDATSAIESATGITPVVYTKKYKNESGTVASFVPDGYVTFIPEGALGSTWYGTTPEEADLMRNPNTEVSIVNTGVAITRIIKEHPVNTEILASEIVLPSYERMNEVVTLKVTA